MITCQLTHSASYLNWCNICFKVSITFWKCTFTNMKLLYEIGIETYLYTDNRIPIPILSFFKSWRLFPTRVLEIIPSFYFSCFLAKAYCSDNTIHKDHDGACAATSPVHGSEVALDIFCLDLLYINCPAGGTKICGSDGTFYDNMWVIKSLIRHHWKWAAYIFNA